MFARSLSTPAAVRAIVAMRSRVLGLPALALGLLACISAALLITASPAGAVVAEVGSTTVGLQPRNEEFVLDGNGVLGATFANPNGNPVLHATGTYVVYWDPTDHYHGDWQHLIDGFMRNMGVAGGSLSNVFAVDSQYTDRSNQPASHRPTFMGAYTDTEKYPVAGCTDPKPLKPGDAITCLTDAQLRAALETFITSHGLAKGMGSIFYLLTPPGVTVCLDAGEATGHCSDYSGSPGEASYEHSFCSYHSDINPDSVATGDANTIVYAAIPWTAGGFGDYHLKAADQTSTVACQDGGFDPSSNPAEQKEKAKEKSEKEKEELKEKTKEEQAKAKKKEELEGPHPEQPNQLLGTGPDGSYDSGLADLIINQIAVEQQNAVTNPLLNAWQDESRGEATDECRNFFATGTLAGGVTANENTGAGSLADQSLGEGAAYLNTAFNLAADRLPYPSVPCLGGVSLLPQFTAPNPVNANEAVSFDGMESNISLNAAVRFSPGGTPEPNYATYAWNFGDGTSTVSGYAPGAPACTEPWLTPCAASVFHSYQFGGTYTVTLTVTDVGGNVASVSHEVTVVGPAPPSPASTPSSSSSGSGSSSSAAGPPKEAGPEVSAAVVSKSLHLVVRKGLVVRYAVNEQVTGHFEVLLASSLARHLRLHGTPAATGLAAGAAPEIVIGKAILVTTKGGRSAVTIQFGKKTDAALRKLHRASFMLRFVVRNASGGTATVLSSFTLAG